MLELFIDAGELLNLNCNNNFIYELECEWGTRHGETERARETERKRYEWSMLNVYSIRCRNSYAGANDNSHYQWCVGLMVKTTGLEDL